MSIYEKYYEKYNDLKFDLYGYSPPTDGTYTFDGEPRTTGEDYRTVERYKEYQECGFNILLMQFGGLYNGEEWEGSQAKMVMDRAHEAGLKRAIIVDRRIYHLCKVDGGVIGEGKQFANEKELDEFIADCIKPYKDHPAFYGVQLLDEPYGGQLVSVGQTYRSLKRVNPDAFVQCNLLPLCGVAGCNGFFPYEGDWVENWVTYLEIFLNETGADYVMYDSYPICEQWWDSHISRTYILGLQAAAKLCKERGVELHIVAQTFGMTNCGYYYNIMPNEAQLRWQMNLLLGFGVKEFSYFTYWTKQTNDTKGELFHDGQAMMTRDGKRTETWYQIQQIHKEMQKFAPVILNFDYVSDRYFIKTPFKSHPLYIGYVKRGKMEDITATTDQDVVFVHELEDKKNGQKMYSITNVIDSKYADQFNKPQETKITFKKPYTKVDVFERGEWKTVDLVEGSYTASLLPGDAQFILPY